MNGHNQRVFPRIDLQCPVSYRDKLQQDWQLSRLVDFSADGLLMVTNHPVIRNQTMYIQLKPNKDKLLRGHGTVVRCTDKGDGLFHVAIKDVHWDAPPQAAGQHDRDLASKTLVEKNDQELRTFPRITAQCPVRYRSEEDGRWLIGRMLDFSATGILMTTDSKIEQGAHLNLQVEPGSKKIIPALRGVGMVVRCQPIEAQRYQVAIKMIRIEPPARK